MAVEVLDPREAVDVVLVLAEMLDRAAVAQLELAQPGRAQVEMGAAGIVAGEEVERPVEADDLAVGLVEVELAGLGLATISSNIEIWQGPRGPA